MATFVLVHGGWQGGWSWRRVVPHLRASGHEVYTPTLTGLGERAHLLGCVDGLDTHVKDVLGLIEYEDLEEVMLVGHSYGGVVITAVAEVVAEKLSHLVYLDASVPKDGQGMFDLMPPERAEGYREAALSGRPQREAVRHTPLATGYGRDDGERTDPTRGPDNGRNALRRLAQAIDDHGRGDARRSLHYLRAATSARPVLQGCLPATRRLSDDDLSS
jgi:pimeloyl-ACP methyl ester carboxylesterase